MVEESRALAAVRLAELASVQTIASRDSSALLDVFMLLCHRTRYNGPWKLCLGYNSESDRIVYTVRPGNPWLNYL